MLNDILLAQGNQFNDIIIPKDNNLFGKEISPSVYLLDWDTPELDRKSICQELQRISPNKDFYLIVTIDRERSDEVVEVLQAGADDCLFYPYSDAELSARLLIAEKYLKNQSRFSTVLDDIDKANSTIFESPQFLNLLNDSVIISDSVNNLILAVNDRACETYLIEREDFIGMSLKNIWYNSTKDFDMFGVLFKNRYFKGLETTHLRADGFQMKMRVNSSLIKYESHLAILTVNKNITEFQSAEAGIKSANIEWRNTVDAVSDMIILEDSNGRIKRCNKATSEYLNTPYQKLINQPIKFFFPFFGSYDVSAEKEDLEVGFSDKQHSNEKFVDSRKWLEINSHQVRNDLKSGNQSVHVIKDITKRKQFEEELQRLNSVIEQSSNCIIITDLTGKIQYVNSKLTEIIEEPKDGVIGQSVYQLLTYLNKLDISNKILSILLKDKVWQKTFQVKRKQIQVFEEISISLIKDANLKPLNLVFVVRDVTETRQLESIAEAVNMMENVGYIFSGIRHELGNPINSVKTALTVMQNNLEKWSLEQIGLYVGRCLSEISRIEYLLRALKTFSMYENPRIETIEMNQYMENFVSLVSNDFTNLGIQISFYPKNKHLTALCDPRVLHQVMLNLLANAAGAMENEPSPRISISISRVKKRLVICIQDNGIGMNEKQMENLFKPFHTSKPEGTGLGLVIVRKMLIKMNGTIRLESKEGVGTQVFLSLETPEN